MKPWVLLGSGPVPDGDGELRLFRRDAEYSIRTRDAELMNSRLSGSEEALATLVCARLAVRSPKIVIGGLGMGFTLRAALAACGAEAEITVVELVPAVIEWAGGAMASLFGDSLADPRVRLLQGDVGDVVREARAGFDAILLDVDNGPDGLTRADNDRLYSAAGLAEAKRALTLGGVFGVWSAHRDGPFSARLRNSGFAVDEVRVRANKGKRGATHTIWIATRPR